MNKDINEWTEAECFLFGAMLSSGRYFMAGEGNTGKHFQYYQSSDGSIGTVITDSEE